LNGGWQRENIEKAVSRTADTHLSRPDRHGIDVRLLLAQGKIPNHQMIQACVEKM
jgi:hypothetical protein